MQWASLIVAGALSVLACAATAQDVTLARVARAHDAFTEWAETHKTSAVLALVRDGAVVAEIGVRRDVTRPVELASLSKTITGICAAELVGQGTLAWSDTVADRLGAPLDITLAQLVTHQSGLRVDGTQLGMPLWLDTQDGHRSADVLDLILERGGVNDDTSYFYNNENFALAGLMIEAATDRDYADICHDLAVAPAGVEAGMSLRAGAFGPWGGWQMTPGDHALWHAHWFAGDTPLARDPKSLPHTEIEEGLFYGPGVTFRTLEPGNTFWHFGALCFPGRMNRGGYVGTIFADWTVMAAWNRCLEWSAMVALDEAIWQALTGDVE